jgi:hypothetical protein
LLSQLDGFAGLLSAHSRHWLRVATMRYSFSEADLRASCSN